MNELVEKKKRIIEHYIKKKKIIAKDSLDSPENIQKLYSEITEQCISTDGISENQIITNEKYKVVIRKENDFGKVNYSVNDFSSYFLKRFKAIEKILRGRQELENLTSIRRLQQKSEREKVSTIGIVYDKGITKNGNVSLLLEDMSGFIRVIVSKNSPGFEIALDTEMDEVIGVVGTNGNNIIFANNVIYPDVPLATEIKKSEDEVYSVIISDVHIGSNLFLPEMFDDFIKWLCGEYGSEVERKIAEKVKYIFIVGDLVEGVGIFPSQKEELVIYDIYEQYREAARLLSKIPIDKQIILCTGNHDASRIAEPQPRIHKEFAEELYALPNIHIVTNPSIVNIHSNEDFAGFNCLLYHGMSFTYYCDNVKSIKESGLPISDRTGIIMKYLLQRRHLAPTYTSTRIMPNPDEDCLVIDDVPDFFLSGHIHKAVITSYRGVSIISGSCFQSHSAYQEKFGHTPIPGQVPLINLKTRKVTMMEF
ncbi:metallophosphoesterase [Nanoarchaeota archaeon]